MELRILENYSLVSKAKLIISIYSKRATVKMVNNGIVAFFINPDNLFVLQSMLYLS